MRPHPPEVDLCLPAEILLNSRLTAQVFDLGHLTKVFTAVGDFGGAVVVVVVVGGGGGGCKYRNYWSDPLPLVASGGGSSSTYLPAAATGQTESDMPLYTSCPV